MEWTSFCIINNEHIRSEQIDHMGVCNLTQKQLLSFLLSGVMLAMGLGGCMGTSVDSPAASRAEPSTPSRTAENTGSVQQSSLSESDSAPRPQSTGSSQPEAASAPAAGDSIVTSGGESIPLLALEHQDEAAGATVYYTQQITPKAMCSIYAALGAGLSGENIAVKLSTGEPPASNYLDPSLIKELVQQVNGTIVECNTAYGGSRANTAMHYQVAKDHGFTDIAEVVILDEEGSLSLPVTGGERLSENFVGARFSEYDRYLVLSHFKGHAMAGFGGAIKNISIGLGSQEGKWFMPRRMILPPSSMYWSTEKPSAWGAAATGW